MIPKVIEDQINGTYPISEDADADTIAYCERQAAQRGFNLADAVGFGLTLNGAIWV